MVNDGFAIPQDGAAQQWILIEGGVPQRFWVCGSQAGTVDLKRDVEEVKVAEDVVSKLQTPNLFALRLCAVQCFMSVEDWGKINTRPEGCVSLGF